MFRANTTHLVYVCVAFKNALHVYVHISLTLSSLLQLTEIITGHMAFKNGLLNMSGVHSWNERAMNNSVSDRAAGFLFSIAATNSSWMLLIVVYTTYFVEWLLHT